MSKRINADQHSYFEDFQAIVIATLLVALGINFFNSAGLLLGGTAGLAFLGQYASEYSFSVIFFAINLPFYYLSYCQLGRNFTIKTFISVLLLSIFVEFTSAMLQFTLLNSVYAAIMGGLLIGSGLLMLFRHQASLGGLNILAQYLSAKYGISIGKFQMGVDCMVVFLAIFIVDWMSILLSIVAAVSLNLILLVNHKPGRYSGK
ncbi:YitT family protein [Psychromonas sp. MME2]|uniref:YitT family protein n=1 Tax=unclassified Psychromonas TaxID=2614957 RepID=UPI00339C2C31